MLILVKKTDGGAAVMREHELIALFEDGKPVTNGNLLEDGEDCLKEKGIESFLNGGLFVVDGEPRFSYLYEENERTYRHLEHSLVLTEKLKLRMEEKMALREAIVTALRIGGSISDEEFAVLKNTYFPISFT